MGVADRAADCLFIVIIMIVSCYKEWDPEKHQHNVLISLILIIDKRKVVIDIDDHAINQLGLTFPVATSLFVIYVSHSFIIQQNTRSL